MELSMYTQNGPGISGMSLLKIKSFQGQTGQTKLTFKHGFPVNLCRVAFAILAMLLSCPYLDQSPFVFLLFSFYLLLFLLCFDLQIRSTLPLLFFSCPYFRSEPLCTWLHLLFVACYHLVVLCSTATLLSLTPAYISFYFGLNPAFFVLFAVFICFHLLVGLHFHLPLPFFVFEPCYIWLCLWLFPSLTISTWTLFSWFNL